jgi:hypothetical protein
MSQHSDEDELRMRCAIIVRDMILEGWPTARAIAGAVLDEAAKPAPGGPKMREGWQPIETAPKDGTSFLFFAKDWGVRGPGECKRDGDRWWAFGGMGGMECFPTHWMPLPAHPEPTVPEVPARVDGEGAYRDRIAESEAEFFRQLEAEREDPTHDRR